MPFDLKLAVALCFMFIPLFCSPASSEENMRFNDPKQLPELSEQDRLTSKKTDWLIARPKAKARVLRNADATEIYLDNGLVRRSFRLAPDLATIGLDNLMNGEAMLRAVKPEAELVLDGVPYPVGGLTGQPDLAYLLPEWISGMKANPAAFHFTGFATGVAVKRLDWKKVRHSADLLETPPGVSLTFAFSPPAGKLPGIAVEVHYELYDGIPLIAKWLTVKNEGKRKIRLNSFTSEILGLAEADSFVEGVADWEKPNLAVISDYSFGGMTASNAARTTRWIEDPAYATQVNYDLKTPATLESRPPLGPDIDIEPGAAFNTFRTFVLIHDSTERERKGLAVRKMYRSLAPWSTENPLMMHLTSSDPKVAKAAIDQCAEVGFEMVIFSFGSGLNMEDDSPANIAKFKALADYAHSKGIQIGGYSLLASRQIDDANDVINPKTGKTGGAIFGNSPCLGSEWGVRYFQKLKAFIEGTGFDLLEHDGSYPGDVCASTVHPGHHGLEDSQWKQHDRIADLYRWCRSRGVYLNVPDWYLLNGSSKTGMGYRETNWSLPRAQQHIHARQNLFDGTWEKAPTMGWMFVPLTEYQGGGAAATIEPLKEHLPDYELHLANNLGFGVQACYRGPRLFDSEETKTLVKTWVALYKKHRAILESDVLHLRRADGKNLDYVLHVNPDLKEKGLLMVYNPASTTTHQVIDVPLYYSGLHETAKIHERDGVPHTYKLDRNYKVSLPVTLKPNSYTWFVVE